MIKRSVWTVVLSVVLPVMTLAAWGSSGHMVIAKIAELNLSPAILEKVQAILPAGRDLAKIANWADKIRFMRPQTAAWHYVDIPLTASVNRKNIAAFYPPPPAAVVYRIQIDMNILADPTASTKVRREALQYLTHFAGDIHQPLHVANDDDKGGNQKVARLGRKKLSLHQLWDNPFKIDDINAYSQKLNRRISRRQRTQWAQAAVDQVAFESFAIAKTKIYPGLPHGPAQVKLPADYIELIRPIVERRLSQAGIRLAAWLTAALSDQR